MQSSPLVVLRQALCIVQRCVTTHILLQCKIQLSLQHNITDGHRDVCGSAIAAAAVSQPLKGPQSKDLQNLHTLHFNNKDILKTRLP